jgi:hypothetical protein
VVKRQGDLGGIKFRDRVRKALYVMAQRGKGRGTGERKRTLDLRRRVNSSPPGTKSMTM